MARKGNQDFGTDRVAKPTQEQGEPTHQSPALATLVRIADGRDASVHPLLGDHFVIGRDKSCHIQITGDTSVSRKHASVMRRGVSFMIEDLGSSNGVLVNDKRIDGAHELRVGDKVEIGNTVFVFRRRVE
ncbi:MAG: FHA domain-containing protein [Planctomycetes bacterium]|nr:FHA domain-containing protein [Planctomycetota bacterium]